MTTERHIGCLCGRLRGRDDSDRFIWPKAWARCPHSKVPGRSDKGGSERSAEQTCGPMHKTRNSSEVRNDA
jgi:hypothetical protein